MKTECDRFEAWLDEDPRGPCDAALEAHAAACPLCRRSLAIDRSLHERLGGGAAMDASHRAALIEKIVAAAPASRRGSRTVRWLWAPAAAAAAIVIAVALWPAAPKYKPIPPTEILGDFLGPFAQAPAPSNEPAAVTPAAAPADDESSPVSMALAALWGDFEGPVAVGLDALRGPQATASPTPAARPIENATSSKGAVK